MPLYIEKRLNRTIRKVIQIADIANTALAVDVRIDSSQQFNLYGVTFGMEFLAAADKGTLQFQPCLGILNFSIDGVTLPSQIPLSDANDLPFYESIVDGTQLIKTINYAIPTIIQGDRSITFVLFPPFSSAALTGTPTFVLMVRGEVTQIASQDRSRLGDWNLR